MSRVIIIIVLLVSANGAPPAERALYFSRPQDGLKVPVGQAPLQYSSADLIDLELVLRSLSVEDQNNLPLLVIDDYRYDEPNYFVDKRVPNVRFEVMSVQGNGVMTPVSYRAASQGAGKDLKYLRVNVWFQFGRSAAAYWLKDHIGYFGPLIDHHSPGTYQIRAFFRPHPSLPSSVELATPPVTVVVR